MEILNLPKAYDLNLLSTEPKCKCSSIFYDNNVPDTFYQHSVNAELQRVNRSGPHGIVNKFLLFEENFADNRKVVGAE
ncbi:hypothetical protein ACROYT_G010526 [Oculina patagonica]